MTSGYIFDQRDEEIVAAVSKLLQKLLKSNLLTAQQAALAHRMYSAFMQLPALSEELNMVVMMGSIRSSQTGEIFFRELQILEDEHYFQITLTDRFDCSMKGPGRVETVLWKASPGKVCEVPEVTGESSIDRNLMLFADELDAVDSRNTDYTVDVGQFDSCKALELLPSVEERKVEPSAECAKAFVPPKDDSERAAFALANFKIGLKRLVILSHPPIACYICGRSLNELAFVVVDWVTGAKSKVLRCMCCACSQRTGFGIYGNSGGLYARHANGRWIKVGWSSRCDSAKHGGAQ